MNVLIAIVLYLHNKPGTLFSFLKINFPAITPKTLDSYSYQFFFLNHHFFSKSSKMAGRQVSVSTDDCVVNLAINSSIRKLKS